MAAGDPIKVGSLATNGIFLMSSESAILINSFRRRASSDKLAYFDASAGADTGLIFYNFLATYTIKGAVNGSGGLVAATIGVAATVANNISNGGIGSSGGIYPTELELGHEPKNLRELTFTAEQRDKIS
jgi:hypothetical protein